MDSGTARLIIQRGPYEGKSYDLIETQYVLGRSSGNDISLPDAEVSRQHVRFTQQAGGGYAVEDLGSTNGTFVNGRRLSRVTLLQDRDVISLGESIQIVYALSQPQTGAVTPATPTHSAESPTDPNLAPPAARPALSPVQPVPQSVPQSTPPQPMTPVAVPPYPIEEQRPSSKRWILGCGCGFLALILFCVALLFFLDAYQGGQLLYCGPLRPFWELVLGPFGFAPYCI